MCAFLECICNNFDLEDLYKNGLKRTAVCTVKLQVSLDGFSVVLLKFPFLFLSFSLLPVCLILPFRATPSATEACSML